MKSHRTQLSVALLVAFAFAIMAFVVANSGTATAVTSIDNTFVQTEPEVYTLPGLLGRLSWSAVLAGTLITLISMFLLNLLGIAAGLSQVNPERGTESTDPQTLTTGAVIWLAVSNLLALFLGGWLAAYFSGIPEGLDGLLHGIMVWALSGLATILLVMSGLGRMMSGFASLVTAGLNLTGSVASGAAQVAEGAIHTAGNAAGAVGNMTAQTLGVLANGVQGSAQMVSNGISGLSDSAIENTPEVQNALKYQDLSFDEIRMQVEQMMRDAGVNPRRVENEVSDVAQDVKVAAQQAMRHPEHADRILEIALQRVFRRGEDIATDVDRDALINLLTERTGMSRMEVTDQLQRWEDQFSTVKAQTAQARQTAMQKAEEFRQQAEEKANEIYMQAQQRVEEMQREAEMRLNETRREAEHKAREAAQSATETFAKVAAAAALVLLIGAGAAGLGGYLGAPATLPTIEREEVTSDNILEPAQFINSASEFTFAE